MVGVATVAIASSNAIAEKARIISGVVIDELSGETVAEANITTKHGTVATGGDGRFSIALGADDDELIITAPGYVMRRVWVGPTDVMRIVLSPAHELIEARGHVGKVVLVP